MNQNSKTGQCLCGSVKYIIHGRCRDVVMCHCSQCLRFHGHYGAYTSVSRNGIDINNAEQTLTWYDSSTQAKRGFCSRCGSSLFWLKQDSTYIAVTAGSLDQPTDLQTAAHIYTEDLADYYEIHDDLPHHDAGLQS